MREDEANHAARAQFATRRARHTRPLNPACSLHLRRICGTCVNFGGALRGGIPAPCAAFGGDRYPTADAASCGHWSRLFAKGPSGE